MSSAALAGVLWPPPPPLPVEPDQGASDGSDQGTPRPETQLLDFDSLELVEQERLAEPAVVEPVVAEVPVCEAAAEPKSPSEAEDDGADLSELPGVLRPCSGFISDVSYWQQFLSKADPREQAPASAKPVEAPKKAVIVSKKPRAASPEPPVGGAAEEEGFERSLRQQIDDAARAAGAAKQGANGAAVSRSARQGAPSVLDAVDKKAAAGASRKAALQSGREHGGDGGRAEPTADEAARGTAGVARPKAKAALQRERGQGGGDVPAEPAAGEAAQAATGDARKTTRPKPKAGAMAREIQRRKAVDTANRKASGQQHVEKGPIVEVTVRHGYKDCSVTLQVPTTSTMLQIKQALVSLTGKGYVQNTRLVQRTGNTFSDYKDARPLGELRELHVLGLDISRAATAAGGGKVEESDAKASAVKVLSKACNIYADVLVVVSIEGTRHEGDTAICVPENASMRKVRHALAKKLRWPRVLHQGRLAVSEDGVYERLADDEILKGRWWLWLVDMGDEDSDSSSDDCLPDETLKAPPLTVGPNMLRKIWDEAGERNGPGKPPEAGKLASQIVEAAAQRLAQALSPAPGGPMPPKLPILPPAPTSAGAEAQSNAAGEAMRLRAQLVGRWVYGVHPHEWFDISRTRNGSALVVSCQNYETTGKTLQGRLSPDGQWHVAKLTFASDDQDQGTLRVRVLDTGSLRQCYRPPGEERWMEETTSHRAPFQSGAASARVPRLEEVAGIAETKPEEARWKAVSEALVEMLLRIRSDCVAGGRGWMESLNRLISYPPTGLAPFTGGDDLGFDDFAGALLHDVYVAVRADSCLENEEARQLKTLLARMEEYVKDATRHLQPAYDWTAWPGAFGEASHIAAAKAGACRDPPFGGFGEGRRYLLFIGLPVALYVSDCPHLYQLVRRLRSLAQLEPPISADMVRSSLDHDGLPYSMLVYALVAALQALHAVRLPGQGAEGLQSLAPRGGALLFRGLWVPRLIDEHRAEFSWSFNSFSRSMEGVLSVLNFYSCAHGSEAAAIAKGDAHIFILVARLSARGSEWAFPVQLFAGGEWAFPANVEQEVVFPPFVRYVFESGGELSTLQSKAVLEGKIREINRRWDINLAEEAPALMRILNREAVEMKGFKAIGRAPDVTVRFVRVVEPAEPVRELFKAAAPGNTGSLGRLLDFPPVEERMPPQETDWQEALSLVEASGARSWSDWPAENGVPMRLSIVGTWTNFKAEEMWWWGGVLVYPVVIGSKGWESFQLLVDGSWKSVIYPSVTDANVLQKGWKVCGPDDQGHGKNWQIGRQGVERTVPGSRVLVMVSFRTDGAVKGVRWRPA